MNFAAAKGLFARCTYVLLCAYMQYQLLAGLLLNGGVDKSYTMLAIPV